MKWLKTLIIAAILLGYSGIGLSFVRSASAEEPGSAGFTTIKRFGTTTLNLSTDYSDRATEIAPYNKDFGPVFWAEPGHWVEFEINVLEAGDYKLTFNYATDRAVDLNLRVLLNNHTIPIAQFDGRQNAVGWSAFKPFFKEPVARLEKGTHTLKLVFDSVAAEVGTLDITRVNYHPDITINQVSTTVIQLAEGYHRLDGDLAVQGTPPYLSNGSTGSSAVYDVEIEEDGKYRITPDYAGSGADVGLYLGSDLIASFSNSANTSSETTFEPIETKDVHLAKGIYELKMEYNAGGFNAQSLTFKPVREPVIKERGTSVLDLPTDLYENPADLAVTPRSHIVAEADQYVVYNVKVKENGDYAPVLYYNHSGPVTSPIKAQLHIFNDLTADYTHLNLNDPAVTNAKKADFETSASTRSASYQPLVPAGTSTIPLEAGDYKFVLAFKDSGDRFNARSLQFTRVGIGKRHIAQTGSSTIKLGVDLPNANTANEDQEGIFGNGIRVEGSGDASNIGYIPDGGYGIYSIEVEESGWYDVQLMFATENVNNKQTDLYVDDVFKTSFAGSYGTNGWGDYQVFDPNTRHMFYMPKGTHLLKVLFEKSGLNARSFIFTPVAEPKWVEEIKLNHSKASVIMGNTLALEPMFTPSDADNQGIIWKSSDVRYATVDNAGHVYGVRPGTVVITAEAADKGEYGDQTFKAETEVTVVQRPILATLESASGKDGNIFVNAEPYDLSLVLENRTSAPINVSVTAKVRAQDAKLMSTKMLFDGEAQTVDKGGKSITKLDLSSITKYGNYDVDIKLEYDGLVTETSIPFSRSLSVTSDVISSDSIVSVSTHFAQIGGLSRDEQDDMISRNLDLMQKAGIKWIRDEMYWSEEPKGNLIVEDLWKRYVKAAKDRGINVVLILAYGNGYYDAGFPRTEDGIAAFARYAANLAEYFKDDIEYFEIWNEWSGGSLGASSSQPAYIRDARYYTEMLMPTVKAIRAVNPDAKIIAGATVGGDWNWIKGMFNDNPNYTTKEVYDAIDAISMHPYSYPSNPDYRADGRGSAIDDINNAASLIMQPIVDNLNQSDGGERKVKPVWVTEIGWPTSLNGSGVIQERSAAYSSRLLAYAKANSQAGHAGKVGSINLYEFQNGGIGSYNDEYEFGMILSRHYDEIEQPVPRAAKASYISTSAFNALISTAEFVKDHSPEYAHTDTVRGIPSCYVYEFKRPNGNKLMVMWANDDAYKSTTESARTQDVTIPVENGTVRTYDMYGNSESRTVTSDEISVTLTEYPIYIESSTVAQSIVKITDGGAERTGEGSYWPGDTVPIYAGTRDGYIFSGWTSDDVTLFADANSPATTFTMPGKSVTVTANWTKSPVTFDVTFDSTGGTEVTPITGVTSGSKITEPAAPTRSGFTFDGWRMVSATGTRYDFNRPVTGNLTLYAAWIENSDPSEPTDTVKPSWPANSQLTSSNVKQTELTLTWTPAEDNVGVANYEINWGTDRKKTVTGTQLTTTITGLTAATEFTFSVKAVDAAGNRSDSGPSAIVRTLDATSGNPTPNTSTGAPTTEGLTDPKVDKDGNYTVELANGAHTVSIPANLAVKDDRKIKVGNATGTLEIPGSIMKKLQGLLTADEQKDATITFSMVPIPASDRFSLLAHASEASNAAVTAAGEMYNFSLSIRSKDGQERSLAQFDEPITLTLKIDPTASTDLLGIYYIANDGLLTYVGGKLADGNLVAQVTHFSKYAILSYDKSFVDVGATYWASHVIKQMAAKHIIQGVSDTEFAPGRNITRAEFTALIVRALNLKAKGAAPFSDVHASDWFASDIAAANEAGIVNGGGESLFNPNASITREEMAVMLIHAYDYGKGVVSSNEAVHTFADRDRISPWAQAAVSAAQSLGFINGRGDHQFAPKELATRAETAQVIAKLLGM